MLIILDLMGEQCHNETSNCIYKFDNVDSINSHNPVILPLFSCRYTDKLSLSYVSYSFAVNAAPVAVVTFGI